MNDNFFCKEVAIDIAELIIMNSNLETREGDTVFFDNIEKISRNENCISIIFSNGKVVDVTIKERE